jgi:hypothetical protein
VSGADEFLEAESATARLLDGPVGAIWWSGPGLLIAFEGLNPDMLLLADIADEETLAVVSAALEGPASTPHPSPPDRAARGRGAPTPQIGSPNSSPKLPRLAFVSWLARWSPLPVPAFLVHADQGRAAWEINRTAQAFDEFDLAVDELLTLARSVADRHWPVELTAELSQSLTSARAALGPRHRSNGDLRRAADVLADSGSIPQSIPEVWPPRIVPPEPFAARAGAAPAMGLLPFAGLPVALKMAAFSFTVPQSRRHSWNQPVDWQRVPPRILDTSESAVRVVPTGKRELTVEVEPHELPNDANPSADIVARVISPKGARVLSLVPLLWVERSRVYRARLTWSGPTVERVVVDVSGVDMRWSRPNPGDRELAAARRWTLRGLAWGRLAKIAEPWPGDLNNHLREEAHQAFTEAFRALDSAQLHQPERSRRWVSQVGLLKDALTAVPEQPAQPRPSALTMTTTVTAATLGEFVLAARYAGFEGLLH